MDYIGLDQARVQAIEHARDNTDFYGPEYQGIRFVWEVISAEESDEYYEIRLSFRPSGRYRGEPGIEQFIIDKSGDLRIRQLLDEPQAEPGTPSATPVPNIQRTGTSTSPTPTPPSAPASEPSIPLSASPPTSRRRSQQSRLVLGAISIAITMVVVGTVFAVNRGESSPAALSLPTRTSPPTGAATTVDPTEVPAEVLEEVPPTGTLVPQPTAIIIPTVTITPVPTASPTVLPTVAPSPHGPIRLRPHPQRIHHPPLHPRPLPRSPPRSLPRLRRSQHPHRNPCVSRHFSSWMTSSVPTWRWTP